MNEVVNISPRSGRTKIAQRFIAGIVVHYASHSPRSAATECYGSACDSKQVLPPTLPARYRERFCTCRPFQGLGLFSAADPSTEVWAIFKLSAARTLITNAS